MVIHFELPSVLTRYTGGLENVTLEGTTVHEVFEDLFQKYPAYRTRLLDANHRLFPYLLLFLNGEELSRDGLLEMLVSDGSHLELIAAAEGGRE